MMRETKNGVYTRNDKSIDFTFYVSIPVSNKLKFVNFVVNQIVDDKYNSIIRDLIFDFAIVRLLTDVDVKEVIDKDDTMTAIEEFLDETNIVEIVKMNSSELIMELNEAVDDNIEYLTGIRKNSIERSVSQLLNTLARKVEGVDTTTMMEAAKVISNIKGDFTPESMIDAFDNSEIFKNRHREILKEKEQKSERNAELAKKVVKNMKK